MADKFDGVYKNHSPAKNGGWSEEKEKKKAAYKQQKARRIQENGTSNSNMGSNGNLEVAHSVFLDASHMVN